MRFVNSNLEFVSSVELREKNLISKKQTMEILKSSYSLFKSVSPNNLPPGIDIKFKYYNYNPLLAVRFIYKYLSRSDSKYSPV